jgi:uncharacterized protein (TIGR00369 family)
MTIDPDDPLIALMSASHRPPLAEFFQEELLALDADAGFARVSFLAGANICTHLGDVQGGFLAAMLDQVMTLAALASRRFEQALPTLSMKISYLNAAQPGRLEGEGTVVRAGERICFLEGRLRDREGILCTTASATCRFIDVPLQ